MKIVAQMLGIMLIGGALATAACDKKAAAPAAEGAPAVAVEGAPVAVDSPVAPSEAAHAHGAEHAQAGHDHAGHDHAAPAGHDHAAHAGHDHAAHAGHDHAAHAAAPAAGGEVAKAAGGEADCPFHDEKGEGGCAHAGGCDHEATATAKVEAGAAHFGAAFTLSEAKPLAAAVASSADGSEAVVQVSGTIHEVCQKAGCWMVVRDGEAEARVVMKGYAFTVPKDAKGKPTVIEGTLKVRTFTEAQVKHLAEDAGKDPATVSGDRKEYVVTASAISIKG